MTIYAVCAIYTNAQVDADGCRTHSCDVKSLGTIPVSVYVIRLSKTMAKMYKSRSRS